MLFNSLEYLLFLPTVFLIYWLVFKERKAQNLFIVAASYFFYGWWDWTFCCLIAFTSLCSYASGLLVGGCRESKPALAKLYTVANIVVNLSILCVYKYYNFFVDNFVDAFALIGITLERTTLNLILPVGISFYTFQALSYSIDVYKRKLPPTKDIVEFFAFLSFFPQLVAGPIERATSLLPQFQKSRRFDYATAVDGMRQILWGLFKKVVVADNCAAIANGIFDSYGTQSSTALLFGGVMFTFQIYGDFSGYSDIAVGTAKLFGIRLTRNFNCPYFSRDIAEFWRRWHISLTTWFRDYIYIPLGGSRCSKAKVLRNTFVIFLVSGFWHGANWTFVSWGAYNALLFVPLLLVGKNRRYAGNVAGGGKILPSAKEFAQILTTFFWVVVGWIIFRSNNITDAFHYMQRMFCDFSFTAVSCKRHVLIALAIMFVFEWINRTRLHGLEFDYGQGILKYRVVRWMLYATIVLICVSFPGGQSDFIYFQF